MYAGYGFDNSRIPNLMELLAMRGGGFPLMGYGPYNGNPAMIPRPMSPMMPVQGAPQLPTITQQPSFDGGTSLNHGLGAPPVATPQPVTPGSGYRALPTQRPALQPQQIQGILQRWGQQSY